jgi:hypothetical protein
MTPAEIETLSDPLKLRTLADGIVRLYSKPSVLSESINASFARALDEHDASIRINMLALAETLRACADRIDGLLLDKTMGTL